MLKGLTKRVVLTRLPVGHTHEVCPYTAFGLLLSPNEMFAAPLFRQDIDAQFGVLWKRLRGNFIFSPQEQTRHARDTFNTKPDWVEVAAVPGESSFHSLNHFIHRVLSTFDTQISSVFSATL